MSKAKEEPQEPTPDPDYVGYYEEHLAHLYEDEDGELDRDLIQRELYDYATLINRFVEFINFATAGKAKDPRLSLETLQQFSIEAVTLTAKAAIIQAMLELQEDLNSINENNQLDAALDFIALYLVSLGHTLESQDA